jgi:hypothetical protein
MNASEILALISGEDFSIDIDLNAPELEEDDRDTIPVPPHSDMQVWNDDEVDPFLESRDHEDVFFFIGARRCPRHPGVKTSSDDGMFDGPCHLCEGEEMDAYEAWQVDPENPQRKYCNDQPTNKVMDPCWMRGLISCVPTEEDLIPF